VTEVLAYIVLVVITTGLPLAHWSHHLWTRRTTAHTRKEP
jgi:hypothetical protein